MKGETKYTDVLQRVCDYATGLGLVVIDSDSLNPYFKGDLNGTKIWINMNMDDDEELFNILHMVGHAVQWSLDERKRKIGASLQINPNHELLEELLRYEWEANCYGLHILHKLGIHWLDNWLYEKYKEDILYLTHFYITGKKEKIISEIAKENVIIQSLIPKEIPITFTPIEITGSRDGIVIDFNN